MIKAYRYCLRRKDGSEVGFLSNIEEFFGDDLGIRLAWFFEFKLPYPASVPDMSGTKSYFTQKGNRTFHKALGQVKEAAGKAGIPFIRYEVDLPNEAVIYADKYQVITRDQPLACVRA